MRILILAFVILAQLPGSMSAQGVDHIQSYKSIQPDKDYDNILVKKLSSDKNSTVFIIWVKKSVASHKHALHTEVVYILEGKGTMEMGDSTLSIKRGDIITIPQGTYHAVRVTSSQPMKVLSVQSPSFRKRQNI